MALVEGCRHTLEITIPVDEVEAETAKVVSDVQKRARLPGFRPGKAPAAIIRRQFEDDIRQKVLEKLIPRHLTRQFENDNLRVVGTPDITDVHFHAGEPLRFKAEFEVVPEIQLKDYTGLDVPYHEPEVTGEDVDQRIEELRNQHAQFVNQDPRPLVDGDWAVLALESIGGIDGEPIRQEEMTLEMAGADTLPAFTENLGGLSQGEEKEFDVAYPEDYGSPRVAGKTIRFRARVTGVRRKDLPEVDDDFAQECGDFRTVEELREDIRRRLTVQRQAEAQRDAKDKLVDKLVDSHDFPVPETFIERQIRLRLEQRLRAAAAAGVDPKKLNIDWDKAKDSQREPAAREVRASMLLSRIAEREAIHATVDDVDREVERIARQNRETFAAARLRFEKDGTLNRLADHIQTEKTLNFLFEHARKTVE